MVFDSNGDRIADYDCTMDQNIDCIVKSEAAAESIIAEKKFLSWVQNICEQFPEVWSFSEVLPNFSIESSCPDIWAWHLSHRQKSFEKNETTVTNFIGCEMNEFTSAFIYLCISKRVFEIGSDCFYIGRTSFMLIFFDSLRNVQKLVSVFCKLPSQYFHRIDNLTWLYVSGYTIIVELLRENLQWSSPRCQSRTRSTCEGNEAF